MHPIHLFQSPKKLTLIWNEILFKMIKELNVDLCKTLDLWISEPIFDLKGNL